ncbi:hypothetical protein NMG60_11034050 [Bertholletia excelsa]
MNPSGERQQFLNFKPKLPIVAPLIDNRSPIGALKFDEGTVSPGFNQSVNFSNQFIFEDDPPDLGFPYILSFLPDPDSNGVAANSALHSDLNSDLDSLDDNELCGTTLRCLNQILMEEDTEGKPNTSYDPLALQATENPFYEVLNANYPPPFQLTSNTNQDTKSPTASSYLRTSSETSANSRSSASNSTYSNSAADPINSGEGWRKLASSFPGAISLLIDLEKYTLPQESKEVKLEKDEIDNGLRGRKHHDREHCDIEEGRSSEQSTVCEDEVEISEMFDKVLLSTEVKAEPPGCAVREELHTQYGQYKESNGGEKHAKKWGNKNEVDLRTLLISCVQSVTADDHGSVNEQLKQIRLHASPFGNGYQTLAHVFANPIEARLAGTGSQICAVLASKHISATDKSKAHQLHISACPFKKTAIFFAGLKILEVAEKATKLHIIDFAILYGCQWPILIQRFSRRPGGPPELPITGRDFAQPGFRPAKRVEQIGRRLARYCERFYEPIPNETLTIDDPRDAFLKLTRIINPTIFLHTVANGSYNSPFFVTRFREALFHYSALFDMFDANIPCDDQERLIFEKELLGCEIINVIACEGSERGERAESYRQWQARSMRAGFRMPPFNHKVVRRLKAKVQATYHRDFVIEENGDWMLQG